MRVGKRDDGEGDIGNPSRRPSPRTRDTTTSHTPSPGRNHVRGFAVPGESRGGWSNRKRWWCWTRADGGDGSTMSPPGRGSVCRPTPSRGRRGGDGPSPRGAPDAGPRTSTFFRFVARTRRRPRRAAPGTWFDGPSAILRVDVVQSDVQNVRRRASKSRHRRRARVRDGGGGVLRDGGVAGSNPRRTRSRGSVRRRVRVGGRTPPRRRRGVWKIHPGEVAASTGRVPTRTASRASLDLSRGAATLRLSLASVELEGFGAFADAVSYPLAGRGVCAVVGDNRDDRCSDSNGAGKTTLVMAPMWALTGASDTRIEGGSGKTLTKTDVVNDARVARVRLEGTVDDEPFWVERRVSRAKLLSLRYGVGDEERTLADARLTQAAMNRDLGASTAARVAFHGQHTDSGRSGRQRRDAQRRRWANWWTRTRGWRRKRRVNDASPRRGNASPRSTQT